LVKAGEKQIFTSGTISISGPDLSFRPQDSLFTLASLVSTQLPSDIHGLKSPKISSTA